MDSTVAVGEELQVLGLLVQPHVPLLYEGFQLRCQDSPSPADVAHVDRANVEFFWQLDRGHGVSFGGLRPESGSVVTAQLKKTLSNHFSGYKSPPTGT